MTSACEAFVAIAIQLIGLVEIMYTIFNFDEDKYGVIYIALVFYLQPILLFVTKTLAECCFKKRCFSVAFALAAEILQFILYVHFCSWQQQQALLVLATCTVLQSFLILVTPCVGDAGDIDAAEDFARGAIATCVSAIFEGVGLALLLIPGPTPFKEKTYEVPLAFVCWLTSVVVVTLELDENKNGSLYNGAANSLFSTIGCMIPYTAMLIGHFYGKWAFSIYVIVLIFASCCVCCTLCLFAMGVNGEEESNEKGEEESNGGEKAEEESEPSEP